MRPHKKYLSFKLTPMIVMLYLAVRLQAKRIDITCLDFSEQFVGDERYKYEFVHSAEQLAS